MQIRNECLAVVVNELEAVKANFLVDQTGRHIKVTFRIADKPYTCIVPKTSSDWRAVQNARHQTRRLLKGAGMEPSKETKLVVSQIRKEMAAKEPIPVPVPAMVPLADLQAANARILELENIVTKIRADMGAMMELLSEIKPQIINNNVTNIVKKPAYVSRNRERRRA